jgi:hypothetical protein
MSALLNLFAVVGDAFIGFIQQHSDEFAGMVEHIILVGHNGKVFNIPFFIHQLGVHGIERRLIEDGRFSFGMDTLQIAQKGICNDKTGVGVPTAYNLQTLFQFVAERVTSIDIALCNGRCQGHCHCILISFFWGYKNRMHFQAQH